MKRKRVAFAPALCACLFGVALGALFHAPAAVAQDGRGSFVMQAVRTPVPPDIDGAIGDDEWRGASRGEDFIQLEPNREAPSPLQTIVFVQYDGENLYVAFEAHDPEPLIGEMTDRDAQLSRELSTGAAIGKIRLLS